MPFLVSRYFGMRSMAESVRLHLRLLHIGKTPQPGDICLEPASMLQDRTALARLRLCRPGGRGDRDSRAGEIPEPRQRHPSV